MGTNPESGDNVSISIRAATPDDVTLIFSFIQKKAAFDQKVGAFSGDLRVTEDKIRNTIFNGSPFAYVLFVERLGQAFGFALYGFRYSSFAGQPSLWLDDLFVDPAFRSQGAGAAIMKHLSQISTKYDCTHLAWTADARNSRGLRFYQGLGAEITERQGDRCFLKWVPSTR